MLEQLNRQSGSVVENSKNQAQTAQKNVALNTNATYETFRAIDTCLYLNKTSDRSNHASNHYTIETENFQYARSIASAQTSYISTKESTSISLSKQNTAP